MQGSRIVIAGGTGYLGQSLARHLTASGYDVIVLGRNRPRTEISGTFSQWDTREPSLWSHHLGGALALVNLIGRSVDCPKSPENCDEILRSRVESTAALGRAVAALDDKPDVWIQMSTAHRYGDSDTTRCDEDSAFGWGLAPYVAQEWEAAHARFAPASMRHVVLRTSFVLGRTGGALQRLSKLARLGLGGTVGSGRQGISWIHEVDMNRLFEAAITSPLMSGAYIASAPNPVSNAEFMRELRRALGVPIGLPAAAWMVRLAAPLMRTDPELALYGRYCVSRRLPQGGFEFHFPELRAALENLFSREKRERSVSRIVDTSQAG